MAHINQLAPLEVNVTTGEPFLRLRDHPNVILTAPRMADVERTLVVLNDERVNEWLSGVAYPYTREHAEKWIKGTVDRSEEALKPLYAAQEEGKQELAISNGCPVNCLREVRNDGTDVFIGDVTISRWLFEATAIGEEAKAALREENRKRDPGDADIVWTIGDYLAPSHHGQGIMTDAVGTLLHQWAIPRMGLRRVIVTAYQENHASVRVFEKLGFKLTETLDNFAEIKGKLRGLYVLEANFMAPERDGVSTASA